MHHNYLLLAGGMLRNLIWAAGACVAFKTRRWMVTAGFALAAGNGLIFAFESAHFGIASWLNSLSVLVGAPAVALIVAGFIFGTGRYTYDQWKP